MKSWHACLAALVILHSASLGLQAPSVAQATSGANAEHDKSMLQASLESESRLKAENEQLKAENEQLKAEVEQLKAENEQLKAENEQQKAENEQLKAAAAQPKELGKLTPMETNVQSTCCILA